MKRRNIHRLGLVCCLALSLAAGCEKYIDNVTPVSTNEDVSNTIEPTINTTINTTVESTTQSKENSIESNTEELTTQTASTVEEIMQEPVSEETIMSVEPVIERFLAQRESYDYYNDAPNSEYAQRIVLYVTEDVKDLEVISINPEIGEEGELYVSESITLFSKEEFTVDDMLVLELEMPEYIPYRAVRFTDSQGRLHLLGISESGEDGMPILIPLQFKK